MVRLACRRNSSRSVVNALGGRHTGGQTALKLAEKLEKYGIKIIGTSFAALDMAEDRERFSSLLRDLNIPYPAFGAVNTAEEGIALSRTLGFPLLVRRCGNPWVG